MSAEMTTAAAIREWADRLLRPAAARYEADGDTQHLATARAGSVGMHIVPTAIFVRDAIERYEAATGELPAAVALSPLRYLSVAGYADTGYPYHDRAVPICTRRGLGSEEALALSPRDTQELDLVR